MRSTIEHEQNEQLGSIGQDNVDYTRLILWLIKSMHVDEVGADQDIERNVGSLVKKLIERDRDPDSELNAAA